VTRPTQFSPRSKGRSGGRPQQSSRGPSHASRGPKGARQAPPAPDALAELDLPQDETVTVTTFAELSLAEALRNALAADGYERPTPIQARAIPPLLAGRDLLGIAQTGTGKTAAFALPILEHLLAQQVARLAPGQKLPRGRKPKALILAPTRELAAQIAESFASYGRHTPLRSVVIFGGVGQGPQVRALEQGVDILIATPGRLTDLHQQGLVHLDAVDHFVLDEADRMLDMGFIEPIRRIAALVPAKRQTMLFSATMPKEIRHLAAALLTNPTTVSVTPVSSAVDRIDQRLYFVLKAQKTQLLVHLYDEMRMDRVVVFTKTKHGADRLARKLKSNGIRAEAIHGNKKQNQRVRALDAFKSGESPVLVATDVAARGLDIDDVTHVVNYDLPMEPESYVHRIGRTARAGKSGHAVAFCDTEERTQLKQVERLVKFEIPRFQVPAEVPKTDEAAAQAAGLKPKREPIVDRPAADTPGGGRGERSRREPRGAGGRRGGGGARAGGGRKPGSSSGSSSAPRDSGAGNAPTATTGHRFARAGRGAPRGGRR
jgi:ATP-dependent RNA helicase RhlE